MMTPCCATAPRSRRSTCTDPRGSGVDVTAQPTAKISFGSSARGFAYTVNGLSGLLGHVDAALQRIEALPEVPS
jgi:hypothetical protein